MKFLNIMAGTLASLLVVGALATSAEARSRHHHYQRVTHHHVPQRAAVKQTRVAAVQSSGCMDDNTGRYNSCGAKQAAFIRAAAYAPDGSKVDEATRRGRVEARVNYGGTVLGGRFGDCLNRPTTRGLWCGCGSAQEVSLPNRKGYWDLAAHWFEMPRSEPGFNKAVVTSGHVAILKHQISGTTWMAYDPNSGGGLARLHAINIAGKAIVDPSGAPDGGYGRGSHPRHRRYASG